MSAGWGQFNNFSAVANPAKVLAGGGGTWSPQVGRGLPRGPGAEIGSNI